MKLELNATTLTLTIEDGDQIGIDKTYSGPPYVKQFELPDGERYLFMDEADQVNN